MQQLYYELRQQIKERKETNKQLRQQNSELAAKRQVLANTYATLSQSQESAEQQARVHILYSENLAHSELKDRTLATYQLEAQREILNGKLQKIESLQAENQYMEMKILSYKQFMDHISKPKPQIKKHTQVSTLKTEVSGDLPSPRQQQKLLKQSSSSLSPVNQSASPMLIQPAELDRDISKNLVSRSISQDRLQVNEGIQEETDHLPLPVEKKHSLGFGQFQVGLNIGKRAT